jgi:Ca-activated chloride channel family protein
LPVLVGVAVLAAACGGSDDSEVTAEQAQDDVTTDFVDAGSAGSDAEATVPAEGDVAEESAASGDGLAGGGGPAPAAVADGSGFFGEAGDEPAADRAEGNTFADLGFRPFVDTAADPLSTFALDVDTASYSIARRWVDEGVVPPPESVRVEEYVNSFRYDYRAPADGLVVTADGGPSPFNPANVILRVGVQAEEVANSDRPPASLTFVVDTSGSMDRQDRLDLVKTALERLVVELQGDDTVALVTYGDRAQVLLPPTSVADETAILEAIHGLQPTGSTNLEAGLQAGYDLASESFQPGGINRVVLASDGVANVGLVDPDGLVSLIRGDADRGIQLVTVGVGMGNFNDVAMEQLADDGDGFYAYVDTQAEAERLFGDDLVSTLLTVAIDGKIQVELDREVVEQYRLIGFENRAVLDEDFRNDTVDAGELGAGHQVTALYELRLASDVGASDGLGTVQLRWEDPEAQSVREISLEVTGAVLEDRWASTSEDFRLAVTVASLAEVLRGSPYVGDVNLQQVAAEAEALSPGNGAVAELVDLVHRLQAIS